MLGNPSTDILLYEFLGNAANKNATYYVLGLQNQLSFSVHWTVLISHLVRWVSTAKL